MSKVITCSECEYFMSWGGKSTAHECSCGVLMNPGPSDFCSHAKAKPKQIYPLTVILDRYNGTYSGGKWTAWNLKFSDIPPAVSADDCSCAGFFSNSNIVYGTGNTPEKAIEDLRKKLEG